MRLYIERRPRRRTRRQQPTPAADRFERINGLVGGNGRYDPTATGDPTVYGVVDEVAVFGTRALTDADDQPRLPGHRGRRRRRRPAGCRSSPPATAHPDLGATRNRGRARRRRPRRNPGDRPRAPFSARPDGGGWHLRSSTYEYVVLYDSEPWTVRRATPEMDTGAVQHRPHTTQLGTLPGRVRQLQRRMAARRPRPHRTRQKRAAAGHRRDAVQLPNGNLRLVLDRIPDARLDSAPELRTGRRRRLRQLRPGRPDDERHERIGAAPRRSRKYGASCGRSSNGRSRAANGRSPSDHFWTIRQPVPALSALARPAPEQTAAVPETQQRRIARPTTKLRRQPRLRPRLSDLRTATPPPATRLSLQAWQDTPVAAPVRHRQIPAVHPAPTMSSSGGNVPASSSTTTTTPTPSTTTTGVLL